MGGFRLIAADLSVTRRSAAGRTIDPAEMGRRAARREDAEEAEEDDDEDEEDDDNSPAAAAAPEVSASTRSAAADLTGLGRVEEEGFT